MFFKNDGKPRFPNLNMLDLSFNQIKRLDLLWPMSLPRSFVCVNLSNNIIDSFVNQNSLSFKSQVLVPVKDDRYVDVTRNSLTKFDDSILLQYRLNSSDDLSLFLNKILNFDFQFNQFTCDCSYRQSKIVSWYKSRESNFRNMSAPILRLLCSNLRNSSVLSFECLVSLELTWLSKFSENIYLFFNFVLELYPTSYQQKAFEFDSNSANTENC